MKESDKKRVEEWCKERGLKPEDIHEAEKHRKDYNGWMYSAIFYAILAVGIVILVEVLMHVQQDRCIETMFNQTTLNAAKQTCTYILQG